MRRLAWTFAARIGDKYQIRLTRSINIDDVLKAQTYMSMDDLPAMFKDLNWANTGKRSW